MAKVTGQVGWVGKNKFGKYSIKLEDNDIWYNSNYEIKASKGDTVEFDDGGKKYCSKLRVIGSGGSSSSGGGSASNSDKERSLIRQNALRHAGVIVSNAIDCGIEDLNTELIADRTLELARRFEAYSSGEDAVVLDTHGSDKDFLDE